VVSGAQRTLVLGAGGFLGSNIVHSLDVDHLGALILHVRDGEPPVVPEGARTVRGDLTDAAVLEGIIAEVRPGLIVNCVALADVDACDRDPELADALNHRLPARLAAWSASSGSRLVHVSSDAVFDGRGGQYFEDSDPSPINVYGRSKLAGERAVVERDARALVVRTNIIGWSPSGSRSLLEYFHGRLVRSLPAPGFSDIFFRPLPVQWFWPGCARFLAAGSTGIVHLTGPELLSKYAFGLRVARAFDLDPDLVQPVDGLKEAGRASRPPLLDVVPSMLPDGDVMSGSLDVGLEELRLAAPDTGHSSGRRPRPRTEESDG
jgi:dTDP-4-dehydrorhamnose reductase